jgi:rhomboid protease GluP
MGEYVNKYYNYLTNTQGFYIQEFFSNSAGMNKSIAIKEFEQGDFVVLVTDSNEDRNILEECIQYLNSRGRNYKLNKILLVNKNIIDQNYDNTDKVIVNLKSDKIVYCAKGLEPLAQIALLVNDSQIKKNKTSFIDRPVTSVLIAINIIMYIISAVISKSFWDIDPYTLLFLGGQYGPLIEYGQWWRLVTAMFLHGGLLHILFNMYALYILGDQIERIFGKIRYIVLYFVTGVIASVFSYIIEPDILSVGASGAIFGLFGALLIFAIIERDKINKGALGNLVFIIVLNLYIGANSSNINNYAHIGGLISGIVLGLLLMFSLKINSKKQQY